MKECTEIHVLSFHLPVPGVTPHPLHHISKHRLVKLSARYDRIDIICTAAFVEVSLSSQLTENYDLGRYS